MEIIGRKLVYEALSAKQFSYRTVQACQHFSEFFSLYTPWTMW